MKIDWLGAFLITAGVSHAAGLVDAGRQQVRLGVRLELRCWSAAALVALAAAVFVESRGTRSRSSRWTSSATAPSTLAIVASVLVGVAMFGGTVFLSQYFQIALGKSPTVAGLMSLPMIFGLLVVVHRRR